MRHANSRCTLDVYSQARVTAKREAQQRIVEMVIPEEVQALESECNVVGRVNSWVHVSSSNELLELLLS
jgi:hypothetical protein